MINLLTGSKLNIANFEKHAKFNHADQSVANIDKNPFKMMDLKSEKFESQKKVNELKQNHNNSFMPTRPKLLTKLDSGKDIGLHEKTMQKRLQ